MTARLLLLSVVRDEARTLELVARAVARQSRPPDAWIVVDDGSTDETPLILQRLRHELPWLTVRSRGAVQGRPSRSESLALGAPARAINDVLAGIDTSEFAYVGVLDGDVEVPDDFAATLIGRLEADPALGLVGAELVEPDGDGWRRLTVPRHHVHGGARIYRRDCLEALLPLPEVLGWDSVDQAYARMQGYATATAGAAVARHHRPCGEGDGTLRGRLRYGASAYVIGQPPAWVLLRAGKIALSRPRAASGAAFLAGYAGAALKRVPRIEDRDYRRFVRAELRGRLAA